MALSDAGLRDPSMLGVSKYPRNPLDFYPTPKRTVESLISVIGDDLPSYLVWEPFCGDGAMSNVIKPLARDIVSTDIRAYDGFDPDGLFDFFRLTPERMKEIADLKGFMPDAIITNPPYGRIAEQAARHALTLMEAEKGLVIFLCRHDWDTSGRDRVDLFDHRAFSMKIVLRHRPRWIAGSEGGPRHTYAFYVWDWTRPRAAKPIIVYAQ